MTDHEAGLALLCRLTYCYLCQAGVPAGTCNAYARAGSLARTLVFAW